MVRDVKHRTFFRPRCHFETFILLMKEDPSMRLVFFRGFLRLKTSELSGTCKALLAGIFPWSRQREEADERDEGKRLNNNRQLYISPQSKASFYPSRIILFQTSLRKIPMIERRESRACTNGWWKCPLTLLPHRPATTKCSLRVNCMSVNQSQGDISRTKLF